MTVKYEFSPSQPAPVNSVGLIGWLRKNLFSSWLNTAMTLVVGYLLYQMLVPFFSWALINADWVGETREACTSSGACWVFITARWQQFVYGFYPEELYWRVNIVFALLTVLVLWLTLPQTKAKGAVGAFTLTGFPLIAFWLLHGGFLGMEMVDTHQWGGLMLTLVLAVVGCVASLPFGILLALGRRSEMPIISNLSTVYIELWRGVPLITVLFMASVMLPLFMSEGTDADKLMRALIGIVMFSSAYMAEVVRGGLQAIPKGQYEAAEALGLTYWKSTGLIILPQALKITIPSIVNTFIGLFKDTSLVLVIGLFDLLTMVQAALTDPAWLGFAIEGYLFAGLVFWAFCFAMSRYSQALERKLHTGH